MALLSVIIPTFNSQETLVTCLHSVTSQAFVDVEIVVVDGGSTDNTVEILKEASKNHRNINWQSEKDAGIYDAMNKGIEYSTGDWIYFLGSDDKILDTLVFSDIANILTNTTANIIYGDAVMTSDLSRQGGEFNLNRLLTDTNICHQAMFYRRSVFSIVGQFNLNYPILADWDLNIKCFKLFPEKIKYINRMIVLFNNVTGVSNTIFETDPFLKQVPAYYMLSLKHELQNIKGSREYKIGKIIYSILERTKVIHILKALR